MNYVQKDMIARLRKIDGVTVPKAEQIIDLVLGEITKALMEGNRYKLKGFGVFEVRQNKSGRRRNLNSGTTFHKPASRRPHFRFSSAIKKLLNKPAANE